MDVLTLYEALNPAGRIVSKGGGEFCGPCPSCGGRDRFLLWPTHSSGAKGGRFLCRGCGVQGDAVAFLREFQGLSYTEACEELRIAPSRRTGPALERHTAKEWTPSPERLPSAGWMQQAAAFVRECAAGVESGDGLAYLRSRGLTVETARKLGIGWNPADRYDRRSDWGLEDELNPETGRFRKVWLPRGLVLPVRRKAGVVALLIRRADWKPDDDAPKYWQVKGSGNGCCCLGTAGKPVLVVESLLDAVLVWQEAGDVAAAVALTGASKRPDAGTTAFLRAAPLVLWALDFDGPGKKEWTWWAEHFQAVKCPPLAGKDPGDMVKAGIPIRLWVEAGIAVAAAPESRNAARQDEEAPPLPGVPETPQNAPCEAVRSEEEPKAIIPVRSGDEAGNVTPNRTKSEPRERPHPDAFPQVRSTDEARVQSKWEASDTPEAEGGSATQVDGMVDGVNTKKKGLHTVPTPDLAKDVDTVDTPDRAAKVNGLVNTVDPKKKDAATVAGVVAGCNPQKKAGAVQTVDGLDAAAVDCPRYPGGCLVCPEYRGLTRWWCRRLHWWKPWSTPEGELPTVEIRRGHVRHIYRDGTTRLVGIAAAPAVPASVLPPLPGDTSIVQETKASRWHKAARGAVC